MYRWQRGSHLDSGREAMIVVDVIAIVLLMAASFALAASVTGGKK